MKNNEKEVVQLNGKTFIYYSNKGLVYRHPTKILWDERNLPQNKEVIDTLVKIQQDGISLYQTEHKINPSRDYIRDLIRGNETTKKKNLINSFSEFLANKKEQVKTGGLNLSSMGDLTSLNSALLAFEDETKTKFQLSDLTEDFVSRFKEFLLSERKLSSNTTQKRINSLKVFIEYCEGKKA